MRILVLSHGHPELSSGGAERAAYSLFQRLKADPGVKQAVFVARADHQAIGHSAFFGSFRGRSDEILASPPLVDGFTFQSLHLDVLKQLVNELITLVKPDVVHIHHFVFWGIEIFEMFQAAGVKIVFTIHEYAAVCANFGQMIKVDGRLCYAASPAECSMCFPSASAGRFFVRNTILKSLFDKVDHFISPSEFLKARYVAWGVPADRISVVENMVDAEVLARTRTRATDVVPTSSAGGSATPAPRRTVFGFFGQINPFKGLDVLLQATAMLPPEARKSVEVRVHGENRHFREGEFAQRMAGLLEETRDVVRMMGGYRNEDVHDLMSACDWIVIPSVWWENSPVVIQEARIAGRPMICANIGGMAEKVDRKVDLLFPARSAGALAELLTKIASGEALPQHEKLASLARARADADDIHYARHMAMYEQFTRHVAASPPAVLVHVPVAEAKSSKRGRSSKVFRQAQR
jgi:glycosyltransferase involved in cell wall biosynthesis